MKNSEKEENKKSKKNNSTPLESEPKKEENTQMSRKNKFERDYAIIQKMRKVIKAPVDNEGAESCIKKCNSKNRKLLKFQGLVSLLLSPQTKDQITFEATSLLLDYGLTIDNMIKISEKELTELIFKVSFHNNKAKTIKKLAQILRDKYNDDAPETLNEIMKLPGVGRKIGLLYLKGCCGKLEGIAVDTHINKIANRLGWVDEKKTKGKGSIDPDKTSFQLEEIVDKKYWEGINGVLVGFGQEICKSVKPLCEECCLLLKYCPYYKNFVYEKNKNNKKEKGKNKSKSTDKNKKNKSNSNSNNKNNNQSRDKNENKNGSNSKEKNKDGKDEDIKEVNEEVIKDKNKSNSRDKRKDKKKSVKKQKKKIIEYHLDSDSDLDSEDSNWSYGSSFSNDSIKEYFKKKNKSSKKITSIKKNKNEK